MKLATSKLVMVFLAVLLIGALLAVGCAKPAPTTPAPTTPAPTTPAPTTPAAAPVTLKVASGSPPVALASKTLQWMCDEITARTNGNIKFEIFWSGTLLTTQDTNSGLGKGVADVANCAGMFDVPSHPHWSVTSLLASGGDHWALTWGSWEMLHNNPYVQADFDKLNIVPTTGYCIGDNLIMFKKKATTLEDVQGLRMRCFGTAWQTVQRELGMTSAMISMTEVYEAMDKGVVDAAAVTPQFAISYKFYEVGKYFGGLPGLNHTADVTTGFNKDVWNSFDQGTRDIITEVTADTNDYYARSLIETEIEAKKVMTEEYGCEFYDFDPDFCKAYEEAAALSHQEYFDKYDSEGAHTAEVWDQFVKAVAKYDKEVAEKGHPWD
jgi:TRAP-type C4-dicarboxylate transport system substrate-binding protein